MARLFGDGFDMYATMADLGLGRWSSHVGGSDTLVSGTNTAFSVGQAARITTANASFVALFETATNETTVYFSLRFKNTGSTIASQIMSLQFRDGANVQCTIDFRGDNAILVHSGATAGATLATLNGAFSAATWDGYQGKVVINSTTGSVEIRKNGSVTPIINISGVNTRAGSTNNFVNQIALLTSNTTSQIYDIDDVWLNSDNGAAPTSWPGDVRCMTQMAASDSSVAFSASPNPASVSVGTSTNTQSRATDQAVFRSFVASQTGAIATATVGVNTGGTGNLKAAIYDGAHNAVLGTSNVVVNPSAGLVLLTFASPVPVVKGQTYYIGCDQNFTLVYNGDSTATGYTSTIPYASFPSTNPALAGSVNSAPFVLNITPTNSSLVSDPTQDGDATYVFSSAVAQEDRYGITALPVSPAPTAILGVAPFVMWKKSDTGPRTGTLSVTANGSADTGQVVGVTPSLSYTYSQKFMPLDPTGAAWTIPHINSMLVGLTVAS